MQITRLTNHTDYAQQALDCKRSKQILRSINRQPYAIEVWPLVRSIWRKHKLLIIGGSLVGAGLFWVVNLLS